MLAARKHAGDVTEFVAPGLGILHPLHQLVDFIDSDAKLDEMKRHCESAFPKFENMIPSSPMETPLGGFPQRRRRLV
jgi:hypothetical protein